MNRGGRFAETGMHDDAFLRTSGNVASLSIAIAEGTILSNAICFPSDGRRALGAHMQCSYSAQPSEFHLSRNFLKKLIVYPDLHTC